MYISQSVQLLSCVQLFVTPWAAACQAPLSFTVSWSLLKFVTIELVLLSNYFILCHPLLLPSVFPSSRVFSNKSALCIRWPKYWSCSFSISPSNEYSGWFPLGLAALVSFHSKGLWRVLHHHNSEASILWCSAFFMVHVSHSYMTTGEPRALT